jgi:hypothetical protein
VERRRRALEHRRAPQSAALDGDQRVNRVEGGVQLAAALGDHAGDRAHERHLRRERPHLTHLSDVRRRGVAGEYRRQVRFDGFRSAVDLAAVEPDQAAVMGEERGHSGGVAPVPRLEQVAVETSRPRFQINVHCCHERLAARPSPGN